MDRADVKQLDTPKFVGTVATFAVSAECQMLRDKRDGDSGLETRCEDIMGHDAVGSGIGQMVTIPSAHLEQGYKQFTYGNNNAESPKVGVVSAEQIDGQIQQEEHGYTTQSGIFEGGSRYSKSDGDKGGEGSNQTTNVDANQGSCDKEMKAGQSVTSPTIRIDKLEEEEHLMNNKLEEEEHLMNNISQDTPKTLSWAELVEEEQQAKIISQLSPSDLEDYARKEIEQLMKEPLDDIEGGTNPVLNKVPGTEFDTNMNKTFKTDLPIEFDQLMVSQFTDEEMYWSQLIGNKIQLITRRSVSPVGRSSGKLKKLRKRVDYLAHDEGKALMVDMEEYLDTHKVQIQVKTGSPQDEHQWSTPKRRGRHRKRQ